MYTCHFCQTSITEAFVGSKNEGKIYSCFKCFIQTLKPFKFDDELVYYPLFGMRNIQLEDSIAFYSKHGDELARVYLNSYEEGLLSYLREEIDKETNLTTEEVKLVIEPYDLQLKE
ncbi:hypothetical protein [Oceanobacillus sp. FSL K6-3682]|uniref:hypothetical protein n=1 Tax=Oceanobacillus sp. FSL K6-3682 TaxID=2921503 RepID=UPI0030DB5196